MAITKVWMDIGWEGSNPIEFRGAGYDDDEIYSIASGIDWPEPRTRQGTIVIVYLEG